MNPLFQKCLFVTLQSKVLHYIKYQISIKYIFLM